METPLQKRDSSLKFQTRYVECMPDDLGFIITSIEGRVGVEYYDVSQTSQYKPFTFRCHRRKEGDKTLVYPVNMVKFNPIYGTFATCGSDGTVSIWDANKRKKICTIGPYNEPVSSISFHHTGLKIAIATSYTYENNINEINKSHQIHILDLLEEQVKPKS